MLGLGKGLQLLDGLIGSLVVGSGDVKLHDLLALIVTRVLDVDCHFVGIALLGNLRIAIFEGGVAEAEAKGIADGHVERVEVAVAHINVLLVVGIVDILHVTFLALVQHVDAGILVDREILR